MSKSFSLRGAILALAATFAAYLLLSLAMPGNAYAVNNTGPDENDFYPNTTANNLKFEVSGYCIGCGGALNAPSSTVVIYLRSASGTFTINNGYRRCSGDAFGSTYSALTRFDFYRGNDPVGAAAAPSVSDGSMGCNNYTVNYSGAPRVTIGAQVFYTVTVQAVRTSSSSAGGVNSFEINAPSNAIVSYYNQSGDYFTIQDKAAASASNFYSNYNLKFGSDCDLTGPRTVRLRWFDDDHRDAPGAGSNWNQTSADDYRMELYQTPKGGGARVKIAQLLYNGTHTGFTALSNGGYGWTGDNKSGYADFTAQPDMRYEWIWYNVKRTNGVSFQVPFNSIYYLYDCGTWDYEPRLQTPTPAANSTVYPGDTLTIRLRGINTGTIAGTVSHRLRITPTTASGKVTSTSASQWNSQGTLAAGASGPIRAATYTVNSNAPPGQICFRGDVYPDSQSNPSDWDTTGSPPNVCFNVGSLQTWDYQPQPPTGPPDTATGPKPGDTLRISGTVLNTQSGTGGSYTHRILVGPSNTGPWTTTNGWVSSETAIGGNGSRTRAFNYTIPANAANGSQVCFITNANPVAGVSAPRFSITNSSTRWSTPLCYTIYNLRFDLDNDPNIGFNLSNGSGVEQSVPTTYSINNNDAIPSNSTGGPTPNLNVRAQITRGNASINPSSAANANTGQINRNSQYIGGFDVVIGNSAVVGEQICVRVFVNWEEGFSDGTDLANNPAVDGEQCFNVSDGPYLQVLGHDTWAGGGYSIGGSCSLGSGDVSSHTRLTSSGTPMGVGAMDQYGLFAEGSVSGFGSANDPLSDLLTFANTPTSGNLGADRCLANLFDGGGAGGNIDDGLWNAATTPSSSINGISQNADGQYAYDTDQSYTSAGNPFNSFSGNVTVLIDGNLSIRRNIIINSGNLSNGNIPFIVFIVTGDINIADNVTRIDGMYISGPGSLINTCDDGNGPGGDLVADGSCSDHLEVNGSLIAHNIAFRRTYGGTNEAATGNTGNRCNIPSSASYSYSGDNQNCSAETIIFPTWFWLATPHFDRGGGPSSNQYPIQQIRDLPPIF